MLNSPFRNLSIRNKLFLSHSLILLITVGVIYITIRVNDKRLRIEELLSKVEDIRIRSQQQNEAKQDFLLNERYSEDFYKTGNSEAILIHSNLLKDIDADIATINKNTLSSKQEIKESILRITQQVHFQDALFTRMVDSVKQLGFRSTGLVGSLDNFTKELITSRLINPVIVDALKRKEQQYVFLKDNKAAIEFDTLIVNTMRQYANSPSTIAVLNSYRNTFQRIISLENSIGFNKQKGLRSELAEQSKKTDEHVKSMIASIKKSYEQDLAKLEWIFLGLIGIVFAVGLLISYVLAVEITKPIIELNNAAKEVVATKFKDDINPKFIDRLRKDEIGELTHNFNLAVRKIRRSIQIIQDKNNSLELKNRQFLENETDLKKINAQKDKFLSIISHDMRAPLSSIIGFLDYYKDNFNNFTETEIDFVSSNLNAHVKKVVEMLDGLLLWSRSQTGEIQTNLQPIDLAQVITDTVDILNQSATNKRITISLNLHNQLVWADKNMSAFIIRNVLSNAIKFTHEGGRIEIHTQRNKKYAFVIIKDNGVGIPAEHLGKLFQDNVNFSTFGTANEKGIGLGLVLCKDFMNKQNGNIEIESFPGEGTRVNLLFPLIS
ncbi:MAG: hypothetical protein RL596_978 [Bacteroidota bacterium]